MKLLWDIECYYNFFCIGIKNYETKEIIFFEISSERNDVHKIKEFYNNIKKEGKENIFKIAFNSIDYDNIVVNYLLDKYHIIKDWDYSEICNCLKEFSNHVINSQDSYNDPEIRKYKYNNLWTDIDLFRYWSKMSRLSKKISLKSLGIQLNHDIVQELPYKHDSLLEDNQLQVVRDYNIGNDLVILEKLMDELLPEVRQRQDANIKYGFNSYSWDGVKLGLQILLTEYCKKYKYNIKDISSLRGRLEPIKLERILSSKISFKETEKKYRYVTEKGKTTVVCNSFYSLYEHLKRRTVEDTNELSYSVILQGVKYDIKSGGLHSWHNNDYIEPDLNKYIYRDSDATGYYPSLGAVYELTPTHLQGMNIVIGELKTIRAKFKKEGNKKDADLLKLANNGGYYGNLNNVYTPMYDPKQLLAVTLNGQMFLLMLCEKMLEVGFTIDACNTDGISMIFPRDKEETHKQICKEWEDLTLMELEHEDFIKMVRSNINNYLAITTSGKIKRKGFFKVDFNEKGEREIPLGDSCDALVIAKALSLYFVKGIEPEECIKNPEKYGFTIFNYCFSNKINKSYSVFHNNQLQQNLNRYYVGNSKAPYLYKKKEGKNTFEHVLKGNGVWLYNKHEIKPFEEYDINYNYYINEVKKVISELQSKQLTIF